MQLDKEGLSLSTFALCLRLGIHCIPPFLQLYTILRSAFFVDLPIVRGNEFDRLQLYFGQTWRGRSSPRQRASF